MVDTEQHGDTGWLQAFAAIGHIKDRRWEPRGGGVLLVDAPIVWLVTARTVTQVEAEEPLAAWVAGKSGPGLVDLTSSQQRGGIEWIHHPAGLSATPFPLDPSLTIKAFAETQCTRVQRVRALQPAVTLGRLYGAEHDAAAPRDPAVVEGIISLANTESGHLFSTAPLLPHNVGAPLLLASPYGGPVTLAGIVLGSTLLHEDDPRALPVRLSRAICVDAVLELVRGKEATELRRKIVPQKTTESPTPEGGAS